MKIPYRAPVVTDEMRRKALEVLESGTTFGGPETERFEVELAERCGMRYGVTANSGTSVTMLALDARGIGPGDEVVMAANAYIGVLAAVVKLGATPVFVEVEADTGNISSDAAAAAITAKTRAAVPLHMYGFPCDMDPIVAAARPREVFVLEDAAHALGGEYKGRPAGGLGDAGFFSFSGKMITVFSTGGAVVTNDRRLAESASSLRDQGRLRDEKVSFIRRTDAAWYDQRWIGYNMHLSEMACALGRLQLPLLSEFTKHRRKAAAYYTQRFGDAGLPVRLPPSRPWANPSYLHYAIWTPKRDEMVEFLSQRDIGVGVHYPRPLHLLEPVQARYGTREGQFPIAERLCRENMSLPVGPHMTDEMLARVADAVIAFFQEGRAVA
ncbi:MAG: DegT/DnrJ/EryC1/StrS family aminotransferase [bacterium]